jgi:molybdenum-dependent DNA-binding transcriptional regulator ModE
MLRKIDWDNQIGHRLRLRDLHVFFTVAQDGSMSKAAARIGVSTPTVSEVIAGLEHGLGVRLFDRGPGRRANALRRCTAQAGAHRVR